MRCCLKVQSLLIFIASMMIQSCATINLKQIPIDESVILKPNEVMVFGKLSFIKNSIKQTSEGFFTMSVISLIDIEVDEHGMSYRSESGGHSNGIFTDKQGYFYFIAPVGDYGLTTHYSSSKDKSSFGTLPRAILRLRRDEKVIYIGTLNVEVSTRDYGKRGVLSQPLQQCFIDNVSVTDDFAEAKNTFLVRQKSTNYDQFVKNLISIDKLIPAECLSYSNKYEPYKKTDITVLGRVIGKIEKFGKKGRLNWRYTVEVEDGKVMDIIHDHPGYKLGECVRVKNEIENQHIVSRSMNCNVGKLPLTRIPVFIGNSAMESTYIPKHKEGRGSGAGEGAGEGALVGAVAPLQHPIGILFYPFIAPFTIGAGAVIGGVYGTAVSVPKEQAEKLRRTFDKFTGDFDIQKNLLSRVIEESLKTSRHQLYAIDIPQQLNKIDDSAITKSNNTMAIELSVDRIGFEGGKGDEPSVRFVMVIRARIVNRLEDKEIYLGHFKYSGDIQSLTAWTSAGYELLNTNARTGIDILAKRLASELSDF